MISVREHELAEVKRSWIADPFSTVEELEAAVERVLRGPWVSTYRGVDWSSFFLVDAFPGH